MVLSRRAFLRGVAAAAVAIAVPFAAPAPAAMSLPFETLPTDQYIRGDRYRMEFYAYQGLGFAICEPHIALGAQFG